MAILLVPLEKPHDTNSFDCGDEDLNKYLQQTAKQHQSKGISRVIVATDAANPSVVLGFYSLTISEIREQEKPPNLSRGLPRTVPVIRLGRLAVDAKHQKHRLRLGETLLFHAMDAAKELAAIGGGVALVVDAKNDDAASYYQKYDFTAFDDNPLKLFIRIQSLPS